MNTFRRRRGKLSLISSARRTRNIATRWGKGNMPEPENQKASEQRFVLMPQPPEGLTADERSKWWYDTRRPLDDESQPFMAVQTYADKDPNNCRKVIGEMFLLFTDQLEYYVVCGACLSTYHHMQWTGNTRGGHGWRERA